ncbi:MAG: methyltransferase domain-containing protein [Cohaesibacteraceae bacterium]|mgnify:CR=1 FL=1
MTPQNPCCRFCGASLDQLFADLGTTPLSNQFVTDEQASAGLDRPYPLTVRVCGECFLVQADEAVAQSEIFDDQYMYFSSYSDSWVAHAKRYSEAMQDRFHLSKSSLVVEVASNDGYLLQHFQTSGIDVLGIEPTASTAEKAQKRGIKTRIDFFGQRLGRSLADEGIKANLMAANNVLAHVPDIRDFAAGFTELLASDGVVTFEFPHLLNLIRLGQFDTIYHEHYSYLSLLFVDRLMTAVGLRVFDVDELQTHGGSLRVYACHSGAKYERTNSVRQLLEKERGAGLGKLDTYAEFSKLVDRSVESFRAFLTAARSEGKTVYAYGAAAKGNTFFNVCGVDQQDVVCIADRSHAKQGKLLPGSHIPIVSPEKLLSESPDYIIIVPWNLVGEITEGLKPITEKGAQLVTTIPETKVL